jgi:hypothetical protein
MSLKNPVTPSRIDPGTVRLVTQRLNHYATSGPERLSTNIKLQVYDDLEKNEMGGACGTDGGGERCAQGSGGET